MQKLTDEYSLDDWRRLEPDTTYAMVSAHEQMREERYEAEIELAKRPHFAAHEASTREIERLRQQLAAADESARLQASVADEQIQRLRQDVELLWARQEIWRAARLQPDAFREQAGDMLVRIAFEAGEISHGRAAELLGCSVQEIRERGWSQGPGLNALVDCYTAARAAAGGADG